MAGIGKEFNGNTLAMFLEFGKGEYDSFNDFNKIDVRGNGEFKYYGIGLVKNWRS